MGLSTGNWGTASLLHWSGQGRGQPTPGMQSKARAVMASLGPAWPDALTPVATSAEQACTAGPSHGDTGARALCLEARWSVGCWSCRGWAPWKGSTEQRPEEVLHLLWAEGLSGDGSPPGQCSAV